MNILDENIPKDQRLLLQSWRFSIRQIGYDIGRKGVHDDDIILLLHKSRHPTFFTRDIGFYDRTLCHARYGIVYLAVDKIEVAFFVRRLLRHPKFKTQAQRMGTVLRVSSAGISVWYQHAEKVILIDWQS